MNNKILGTGLYGSVIPISNAKVKKVFNTINDLAELKNCSNRMTKLKSFLMRS